MPTITPIEPQLAIAQEFLTRLDDSDESFVFQVFDDSPNKDDSLAKKYIGTLEQHWDTFVRLNAHRIGIFVTVNRTDGKGRKLENIIQPRCVFCEWDKVGEAFPQWPLDPHMIVESSHKKYHLYWLCDESVTLEDFDQVMATLVTTYGSDKNAKDRARVLRIPGFYHQKHSKPFQVRLVESQPFQPYSREQLLEAFPPPVSTNKYRICDPTFFSPASHSDAHWQSIIIRLVGDHAARTWRDPTVGRHAQILSLGYSLAERGVPQSFDDQALQLFGQIMRPTDTAGNPAPMNIPHELKALRDGRDKAIGEPSVQHGDSIAEALLKSLPVSEPTRDDVPELPTELVLPHGLLGDFVKWTCRTARFPQPFLAVGNGLALLGAIIGQTARTATDLRTNLYTLGVSPSASGKDHSRKCAKRLLAALGLQTRLGGENLASDTGLLDAVFRSPACLFQIDEFGRVLKTLTKPEKSHLYAIPTALMQLYSAANDLFLGKEYAGGDTVTRRDIDQPCACLYGTTVPSHFFKALTHDEAEDGFLARFLIFQGEDDPVEQTPCLEPPPDSLVAALKEVATKPRNVSPTGNIDALDGVKPLIYPFDVVAHEEFQTLSKTLTEQRRHHRKERTDAIWGRCWEHAAKVALILAATSGRELHQITGEDAHYGIELAKWSCSAMAGYVATHVAENETESVVKRVARIVRDAGSDGLSMSELTRKTQFLKRRERSDVLDDLLEGGIIVVLKTPTKTKVSAVIKHSAFC